MPGCGLPIARIRAVRKDERLRVIVNAPQLRMRCLDAGRRYRSAGSASSRMDGGIRSRPDTGEYISTIRNSAPADATAARIIDARAVPVGGETTPKPKKMITSHETTTASIGRLRTRLCDPRKHEAGVLHVGQLAERLLAQPRQVRVDLRQAFDCIGQSFARLQAGFAPRLWQRRLVAGPDVADRQSDGLPQQLPGRLGLRSVSHQQAIEHRHVGRYLGELALDGAVVRLGGADEES